MPPRRPRPLFGVLAALVLLGGAVVHLPSPAAAGAVPDNLAYSDGAVMASSITYPIFWLPAGFAFEPGGSDPTYESLIERFLIDVGGTTYYNVLTQYPGSTTPVVASSGLGGFLVDTTPYPAAGTQQQPLHDADIQAEVSRAMTAAGWSPGPGKLFLVFTASGIQSCLDASNAQCSWDTYCAYHASFVSGGQSVDYAALPDAGGDGCLSQTAGAAYPNGDATADSEISLVSKELFAAVSDPGGDGWSDSTGAEIGDKCDWDFGTIGAGGSNLTLNGHPYLVQREWSNADGGCVLSYGTVVPTPTPTAGVPATRLTPTAVVAGTPTPTPTAVTNQATRLTPTPASGGTPTPTPTPASGRGTRPGQPFFGFSRLRRSGPGQSRIRWPRRSQQLLPRLAGRRLLSSEEALHRPLARTTAEPDTLANDPGRRVR